MIKLMEIESVQLRASIKKAANPFIKKKAAIPNHRHVIDYAPD
ncbi:MAG: hypothetical protein ABF586_05255 [Sporolactobacillus sp.]